jgi:hypothetical protein
MKEIAVAAVAAVVLGTAALSSPGKPGAGGMAMLRNAGITPTRAGGGIITGAHTPIGANRLIRRRGLAP